MRIAIIMFMVLFTASCEPDTPSTGYYNIGKHDSSRFQVVSHNGDMRPPAFGTRFPSVTIIVDRETGIEYLYLWSGMGDGGPAITRLWEKEE